MWLCHLKPQVPPTRHPGSWGIKSPVSDQAVYQALTTGSKNKYEGLRYRCTHDPKSAAHLANRHTVWRGHWPNEYDSEIIAADADYDREPCDACANCLVSKVAHGDC